MPAIALGRAACGAALLLLVPAAPASADEGDACVSAYEQAQQLRRDGQPVRARAELRLCLGACPTLLVRDCERWLKEVEPEIARVAIAVRDEAGRPLAGTRVLVDGAAVPEGSAPLELDPGRHVVHADAPGRLAVERAIDARPGVSTPLELRLAAAPPPRTAGPPRASDEDRGTRRVGFVLGGVGVLSLATAAVLSAAGHVQKAQLLDAGCRPYCPEEKVEAIRTMWVTGGVLAGAGAAALGVGASLLLLTSKADSTPLRPVALATPDARGGWLGVAAVF